MTTLTALAILSATTLGGTHARSVPLQQAIDEAPAGATVRVFGRNGPVVVRRPVRLVAGEPGASIDYDPIPDSPPVTLLGAGGTVELVGLAIGRTGTWHSDGIHGPVAPVVWGSGFEALFVRGCALDAMDFSGDASVGAACVETQGQMLVVLEASRLRSAGACGYDVVSYGPSSPPAVFAREATVIAIDSDVRAGDAGAFFTPGPCSRAIPVEGGRGAPGVLCSRYGSLRSRVTAGAGGTWFVDGEACWTAPTPPAVVETGR